MKLMKTIMGDDYAWYASLSRSEKARGWYAIASLILLVLFCESNIVLMVASVINFAISALLISKVK